MNVTNSTLVTGCPGGDASWKWMIACMLSVVASCGAATGLVLQKYADNTQQSLLIDKKAPEHGGFILSPRWLDTVAASLSS